MKIRTEQDIDDWVLAAKALAAVSAWNDLGLFERLRSGPVQRSEIPADSRAVEVTVPVLAHVGLVVTDGNWVGLSETGLRLLNERALPTARNLDTLRDLGRMTDVLRDGGPVRDDAGGSKGTRGGTRIEDPAHTERFLEMLYRTSEESARSTFAWLSPQMPTKGSMLDLGGGHGRYARVFADAGYAVTIFDQPSVITLAKKRHGEAMRYLDGDFHTVDSFGGPYDLVLACNIVHGESADANASLIARAARSLSPNGRIAIRDMFLDDLGRDPASAVFFGMTMLMYTEHGTSPTTREVKDWLARAGLVDFALAVFETHQIAIARKP